MWRPRRQRPPLLVKWTIYLVRLVQRPSLRTGPSRHLAHPHPLQPPALTFFPMTCCRLQASQSRVVTWWPLCLPPYHKCTSLRHNYILPMARAFLTQLPNPHHTDLWSVSVGSSIRICFYCCHGIILYPTESIGPEISTKAQYILVIVSYSKNYIRCTCNSSLLLCIL